jgi:hypothetical protein
MKMSLGAVYGWSTCFALALTLLAFVIVGGSGSSRA